MNSHYQRKSQELASDRAVVEDARKALVKERLELELLRRQMERWCIKFATNTFAKISQSRRWPLLGPAPG